MSAPSRRVRWSLMKQRLRRLVRESGAYAAMCEHHATVMRRLAAKGNHPHLSAHLPELAADLARNCGACCGREPTTGLGRER